ncbi:hypothetical protein KP509_02G097300 [Ceratopteris richardii]|uniref:Phosphatidylethanolamine-binding protein n=1 Tax=Ceratopteris richardii TaxID=49495 RepID=A0A8T2VH50_CERRI|nr:hypothetical protein KP509_02G097300 [Ceratopteris richardii]
MATKLWMMAVLSLLKVLEICAVGQEDEVVPAWLDAFGAERVQLAISFNGSSVRPGQLLPKNLTSSSPCVLLDVPSSLNSSWITVIMVDPDAPSPASPSLSLILHWIVSNVAPPHQNGRDILEYGMEDVTYLRPGPVGGIHRYYLLAFKQTQEIQVEPIEERINFSLRNFTAKYDLNYPVGGTLFRVEADSESNGDCTQFTK